MVAILKVESIAECSLAAFCNTFDLHYAIISLKNNFCLLFEWPLKSGFTASLEILVVTSASSECYRRVCALNQTKFERS